MADFNLDEKMAKVLDHLDSEFQGIRTGRAHPGLVEGVKVDYYGSPTPLKQLANITVPEARMLIIAPFDKGAVKLIEKAILAANIGLTPNVDGNNIRLVVPELTGERRLQEAGESFGDHRGRSQKDARRRAEDHR